MPFNRGQVSFSSTQHRRGYVPFAMTVHSEKAAGHACRRPFFPEEGTPHWACSHASVLAAAVFAAAFLRCPWGGAGRHWLGRTSGRFQGIPRRTPGKRMCCFPVGVCYTEERRWEEEQAERRETPVKKVLLIFGLLYILAFVSVQINAGLGVFPEEIFSGVVAGVFWGGTLLYVVIKNRHRLLGVIKRGVVGLSSLKSKAAAGENPAAGPDAFQPPTARKRTDKVLIGVFSLSIGIQLFSFLAMTVVNLVGLAASVPGLIFPLLVPAVLSLATSVLTVHLHVRKKRIPYSAGDIGINGLFAFAITAPAVATLFFVWLIVALVSLLTGPVFNGWFLFVFSCILFGAVLACAIAAGCLILGIIGYMRLLKKRR